MATVQVADVVANLGAAHEPSTRAVPVSLVLLLTLAMAGATGLGAVPLFFMRLQAHWAGICNGIASGVMIAASFDLIQEGQRDGGGIWVVLGILAGGLFIWCSQKVLEGHEDVKVMDMKAVDARKMALVVGIMTLHSFGEGSGVGVSFAGQKGLPQGLLVTLAIAVHNIPEGLAVSVVLSSRGVSARRAMIWSIITSLPQPLVAVPAFMCAEAFQKILPFCVGFAGGCMIWMVFAEVLPDSFKEANASHVATSATLSVAFMEVLSAFAESFQRTPRWDDGRALLLSLLFGLGPFVGGVWSLLFVGSMATPPMFLLGIASGAAFAMATWRPLQLLLYGQVGFLATASLLFAGCLAFWVLEKVAPGLAESKAQKGEVLRSGPGKLVTPVLRQALLVSTTIAFHAFAEGLALGVAAPEASGVGLVHMLLPVSLHGLPRGATVAMVLYSATSSWRTALLGAAVTGWAAPVASIGAILAGLGYRGLDYCMVVACGGLYAAFGGNLLRRALSLDGKSTVLGVLLGSSLAVTCLASTRLVCLHTPYCNSAPEAVK